MSTSSFIKGYDTTIKAALYSRFGSTLGILESSHEEENMNKNVLQWPKETALRHRAEKQGQDFLEFINFWRMGVSFSWDRQSTVVARRGLWLNVSESKSETVHVKAVPIDLSYNAWFWSKDLDKIYQCIEEYTLWQQDNPQITVLYNDVYPLQPDLHFGEIVDESTVPEEFSKGILLCYKMPIKLEGWVLKSTTLKTIYKIIVTVYDKNEITSYEEVIGEDADSTLESVLRLFRRSLYYISAIDLVGNAIILPKDYSSDFSVGNKIQIVNSSNNNGMYTVVSVTTQNSNTVVTVLESLKSSKVDGSVYRIS